VVSEHRLHCAGPYFVFTGCAAPCCAAVDFSLLSDEHDVLWQQHHRETKEEIKARGLAFMAQVMARPERNIAVGLGLGVEEGFVRRGDGWLFLSLQCLPGSGRSWHARSATLQCVRAVDLQALRGGTRASCCWFCSVSS
jgi:hypothetical protein